MNRIEYWSPFIQFARLRIKCRLLSLPSPDKEPTDSTCLVFVTGSIGPTAVVFVPKGGPSVFISKRGWGVIQTVSPVEGEFYRTSFGWGPTTGGRVTLQMSPGESYIYQVRHIYFRRGIAVRILSSSTKRERRRRRYFIADA